MMRLNCYCDEGLKKIRTLIAAGGRGGVLKTADKRGFPLGRTAGVLSPPSDPPKPRVKLARKISAQFRANEREQMQLDPDNLPATVEALCRVGIYLVAQARREGRADQSCETCLRVAPFRRSRKTVYGRRIRSQDLINTPRSASRDLSARHQNWLAAENSRPNMKRRPLIGAAF